MDGQVVHILVYMIQNGSLPLGEGGHFRERAAGGHQLNAVVNFPHGPGGFHCQTAVFLCGFVTHLPGAVHFVAQTPGFDAVGLGSAVRNPEVAVQSAGGVVAVFQQVAGVVNTPGAQIHGHHHLDADFPAPTGKFLHTYLIGFQGAPGPVQPYGTLIFGPNPVFPPVTGYEVAAGIANQGDVQGADQIQKILPEACSVGAGMLRTINAIVNRSAQMLNKGAE